MKINILYWDNGDKQRLDNTNLSWYYLKNFAKYATEHGCPVEAFLFDFSEVQVLNEAIHIPYPKGEYKRSEKINKVIAHHADIDTFIGIMDSDVIINPADYDAMTYLIKTAKNTNFYVHAVNDLLSIKGVDFENKKINFEELEMQPRNFTPDLGGFFFMHKSLFKIAGGMDERCIEWGVEDNIAALNLIKHGFKKKILPLIPIHLPHINLQPEAVKTKQYQKQLKIYTDMLNGKTSN